MDRLIRDFGNSYDLADLELDDRGYVCIVSEDGVVLNIDYFEEDEALVFYTTVGEIEDGHRLTLYEEMLKANFFWENTAGATLCIDPNATLALLTASITVTDLDLPKMLIVMDHFTRLTWAWSDRIREITGEATSLGDAAGQDREPGAPGPAQLA